MEPVRLYVPLAKAGETTTRGVPHRFVYGVASTPDWDLQEQRLLQEGMDFQPLIQSGFFNWSTTAARPRVNPL